MVRQYCHAHPDGGTVKCVNSVVLSYERDSGECRRTTPSVQRNAAQCLHSDPVPRMPSSPAEWAQRVLAQVRAVAGLMYYTRKSTAYLGGIRVLWQGLGQRWHDASELCSI